MADRRQSLSNKQVVGTDEDVQIPSGPTAGGVSGLRYFDAPVDDGQAEEDSTPGTGITQELETPRDLKVESQQVQFNPDGVQYITVVVSFETSIEADGHEVRISAA